MSSPTHTLPRRQFLRLAAGSTAVLGLGGSTATAAQDDDLESDRRYVDIYEETIDDVVLVNVFGTDGEMAGGLGSGFVIDDEHVVTNQHVVQDANEVELQFRDEQWRTASVVGSDVHSDLAVLAVDDLPDGPDSLAFADGKPEIGAEVLALGNPLGLDASISQGIVSGVDRSLPSPTGFSIPAAIQTDAPVNPGNSGGPLVDLEGDVVGVVFAGAGQAIGFAISGLLADRVVPALIEDGAYDHPYMGVNVLPVGPQIADANDLEEPRGVLVIDVVPDAPADGILEPADETEPVDGAPVPVGGDVIVAIADQEIPNQDILSSTLALETAPGETVAVEVVRDGERETVDLTLEPRPDVDVP